MSGQLVKINTRVHFEDVRSKQQGGDGHGLCVAALVVGQGQDVEPIDLSVTYSDGKTINVLAVKATPARPWGTTDAASKWGTPRSVGTYHTPGQHPSRIKQAS